MASQNKELIKLNNEQLSEIYTKTTQIILDYLSENESKITNENSDTFNIGNKFDEEATKLIKSKIMQIAKNFEESSQEYQQKNIQYNLIAVEKVLNEHKK